jgi:UDP-N-acetyl-D-mannosaminuronic acid dehydrogenase
MAFWGTLTQAELLPCTAAEAALAKLAENAEREIRIAFANELADAASAASVDPNRATELANSHPRTALLRHGVGVGGTCLPMAPRWFAMRGDGVAAAARALHERRPRTIAARLATNLPTGAKICVLGRTYRPNVAYEEAIDDYDSPALVLIAALRQHGFEVSSWDPSDTTGTRAEAEAGAEVVLIAVPHAEFSDSTPCS